MRRQGETGDPALRTESACFSPAVLSFGWKSPRKQGSIFGESIHVSHESDSRFDGR